MTKLSRRALRATTVTAFLCTAAVAHGQSAPTQPKYASGKIIATWPSKPPAALAACWQPAAGVNPKTGAGSYQLQNATTVCAGSLGLTKVPIILDAKGNVTLIGGTAPTGSVHVFEGTATPTPAPFPSLLAAGAASDALKTGILLTDDKGVYLPASITAGGAAPAPAPAPAAPAVAGAPKLSVADKKLVADLPSNPDTKCWTDTGKAGATAGTETYYLVNASPACTASLKLKATAVTIDGSGTLTFAGKPQKGAIASLDDKGNVLPEVGVLEDPATATADANAGLLLGDDDGVYLVGSVTNKDLDAAPCTWPRQADDNAHVDVDLPRSSVVVVPKRNVINPNQALTVRVCHVRGETVNVAWGGTRGLTVASTNNQGPEQGQSVQALEGQPAPAPQQTPVDVSEVHFAPRQPGSADVTITEGTGLNAKTITVELQVDTLYWGSIRFGLGTVFDVANKSRNYAISTTAGSLQPEITESHDTVGFEIVTGFAPYLFDDIFGHGRSYTGGTNWFVAPFVGFGVVGGGTNQAGVEALSSFHAGLEVEFSQSFSIAVTYVERRGQGLDPRYHVGSPVTSGMTVADVTSDSWSPGLGVIVNASPSFLQFATGSGSGTTTKTTSGTTTTPTSGTQNAGTNK